MGGLLSTSDHRSAARVWGRAPEHFRRRLQRWQCHTPAPGSSPIVAPATCDSEPQSSPPAAAAAAHPWLPPSHGGGSGTHRITCTQLHQGTALHSCALAAHLLAAKREESCVEQLGALDKRAEALGCGAPVKPAAVHLPAAWGHLQDKGMAGNAQQVKVLSSLRVDVVLCRDWVWVCRVILNMRQFRLQQTRQKATGAHHARRIAAGILLGTAPGSGR